MSGPRIAGRRPIAVVGAGYVGLISAVGFAKLGHTVELIESDPDRLAALREGRVPFVEAGVQQALTTAIQAGHLQILSRVTETTAGIVLICVGTPIDDRGHADMRAVEGVLDDLRSFQARPIVVVRSTMPVGTSQRLIRDGRIPDETRFFAIPEFLRQGSALRDFMEPDRIIIGRPSAADAVAEATLEDLFGSFASPMRLVTLEESELIKNAANAFLALKISFVNEIAFLSERSGADIGQVLDGMGLDPRIGLGSMHPSFGFGGGCLPKELQTIAISGRERGLDMHVTSAAAEANLAHQGLFAQRIVGAMGGVAGRSVALLGLAFKAGTDDIRSSPAIQLARWLLARDATVHAFDPAAMANARLAVPGLTVHDTVAGALTGADAAVIATEWPDFRDLDWARFRELMASPLVVDGRRLLDPVEMRALGYRYLRVGSPAA